MQAYADVLLRASERTGEAHWQRPLARSVYNRRGAATYGRCAIGRGVAPVSEHEETGSAPVVLASVWLVFFVIAAGHVVAFGH